MGMVMTLCLPWSRLYSMSGGNVLSDDSRDVTGDATGTFGVLALITDPLKKNYIQLILRW